MDYTLDQLLVLDAIDRTGSFAGAAKALFKVPSAVSYNIQSLESALGVNVFDRSRRRATLTAAGRRLLEASREVIAKARELERVAAELRDGWEPELHVVVDGALPISPITSCVRRFADPDVPTALRVDIEYQDGVTDAFATHHADIALILGFDDDDEGDGYDVRPLPALEMLLVAAPDHPLVGTPLDPKRRAGHAELVVRDSSPRFAKTSRASFMGSRNVCYLSDFHSKRIALVNSAGYGWVPRHLIADDLSSGRLVKLDAELNSWTYEPLVVTRSELSLGRGGQMFLEVLAGDLTDDQWPQASP